MVIFFEFQINCDPPMFYPPLLERESEDTFFERSKKILTEILNNNVIFENC